MKNLVLLGYGKMAMAICKGLKRTNQQKFNIQVCGRDFKKIQYFCEQTQATPHYTDRVISVQDQEVLLCIKPYALANFEFIGRAKCVYSVLNAVSLETLKENIESQYYIRAMPNVCANIGKSVTSLCGDIDYQEKAFEIFNSIGSCIWIEEASFPAATALCGCAPAFLAIVAESMMDSGVINGLSREQASTMVKGLFEGFGEMLKDIHPTLLKESVMSPGGSTAQGISALEKNSLRNAFFEAILASKNFA
ncbi:MAG: pyrroline-5-carboxylate reductase [Helicobacter sp.]|nr:pyrroline-5-carboxylate reductase [Helicobacter sp.]